ncbi:MAG: GNAT family N-acetyltransferase [Gemmatimonadaceae bacterium]|nr:GNAT family N-acetyltransferase [Gemmatimonadaceae bacterium]
MNATVKKSSEVERGLRIEPVDHAHAAWRGVLSLITRTGDRRNLCIDTDGWLSARQIVFAAMVDGKAVAHLSFHIEPGGRLCVEARLDMYGIDSGYANRGIERRLWNAAVTRARELRCARLIGFDLKTPWK